MDLKFLPSEREQIVTHVHKNLCQNAFLYLEGKQITKHLDLGK